VRTGFLILLTIQIILNIYGLYSIATGVLDVVSLVFTVLILSTQIFGFSSVWRESRIGVLIYAVTYGILELAADGYSLWSLQSDEYLKSVREIYNNQKEKPIPFEQFAATVKSIATASIALSFVFLAVVLWFAYKYYKYLTYVQKSKGSNV
jgi:hypothetical protein